MSADAPIRVLVADDSPTARAALAAVLEADEDFEVVAEAVDGAHAVELVRMFQPALVLMDIEMPRLDGFEATRRIMSENPTRVVMVSGRFEPHQVHVVVQAVRAGALTVVPKPRAPAGTDSLEAARLRTLAKALAQVKVVRQRGSCGAPRPLPSIARRAGVDRPALGVVGVAASTGGPAAVFRLLQLMPPTLGVPIVVVQHIAPGFLDGLTTWLAGATSLPVKVAHDGEDLRRGHVYLAPDQRHIRIHDGLVHLSAETADGGFCPSADVLFTSLADSYGSTAAGVILSGMGHDGVHGAAALRQAGGLVLAQDDSSVIFGMPRAVAAAGLAHLVGPVEELAAQIIRSAVPRAVVA